MRTGHSITAIVALLVAVSRPDAQSGITRFPADAARDVSPDTHLVLTFPTTPTLGTSGQIRIYDATDNTTPGAPSGAAAPTSRDYQLTIIGGFRDGFHFYPVIARQGRDDLSASQPAAIRQEVLRAD